MATEQEEELEDSTEEQSMLLTPASQYYLQQAGKWAAFLGIAGFIFSGIILFAAITIGPVLTKMQATPGASAFPMNSTTASVISFVYGLFSVLGFLFSLYLYQFGSGVKEGILHNDGAKTNASFIKLNSFFKLCGVTTIIIIVVYVLLLILVTFGGAAALLGNAALDVNVH